jgi:hypothetical protein
MSLMEFPFKGIQVQNLYYNILILAGSGHFYNLVSPGFRPYMTNLSTKLVYRLDKRYKSILNPLT